jgi:hypothetical protein
MPDPARADELLGFLTLMGGGAFIAIGSGAINVEVSGRAILVVAGAFLELVGLGFGVYPDVVPYGPQISRRLDRLYRLLPIRRNQDRTPGTGALFASSVDFVNVQASGNLAVGLADQIKTLEKRRPRLSMMSPLSRLNSRHCSMTGRSDSPTLRRASSTPLPRSLTSIGRSASPG